MTVNEMIERLQEVAEDGFGECELRLAFQPKWALQFTIGEIAVPDDDSRGKGEPDEEPDDAGSVVYITEGDHPRDDSPYAPDWAFPAARQEEEITMAKISARGATAAAQVKRTFTLEDGTVVTQHRVLCSDRRILERTNYRESDGRRHATGYTLKGKTIAVRDSWLVAQLANGWTRD